MHPSTPSSERTRDASLTGEPPRLRAGLRVPPSGEQPNGVFVVVEMAILVIVAALAMASIIVSSSGGDLVQADGATAQSRSQAVGQTASPPAAVAT